MYIILKSSSGKHNITW